MHIGLFHSDLPQPGRKPGGVSVVVHRLANALAEGGDDRVTVYSLDRRPADASYEHVQLFKGFPWLLASKSARMLVLPALLNFVDFGEVDLLHFHGDDWFYIARRKPLVRTLHGSALREAQSAQSRKRRWAQFLTYGLERISARLADASLAVGDDARMIYSAGQTVNNGVDLQRFHPGEKSAEPSILFVGTWAGRKRGQFIFEQFQRYVLPRIPSAEMIMVSDRCDPGPGVRWVEAPDDQTLASLYRSAWVFAYPSLYEGFGVPYIEAMASGTVVLASPNASAAHIMEGGCSGVIADDASFGIALCRLIEQSALREQFERTAIQRAADFSWSRVADEHRKIYQSVLRN